MSTTVDDLKNFYLTRLGRVTRRIIKARLDEVWPEEACANMRVLGTGYAVPYLSAYQEKAECVFSLMPENTGAEAWPKCNHALSLAALSDPSALPIETNSIDRIVMMHDLEHCESINAALTEVWRILKSNGRLIVIAPNRSGFWARSDKTPFGQGRPFSTSQLKTLLYQNDFIHERTEEALFMPPLAYTPIFKFADTFERIGKTAFPIAAGIHIIEASKQLYAKADKGSGVAVNTKRSAVPKPAISNSKDRWDRPRP